MPPYVNASSEIELPAGQIKSCGAAALSPAYQAGKAEFLGQQLEGDISVPIAIIGGGLTGISTAFHLRELGVDVALIEAATIGAGASGRNGGQVNPGLKPAPSRIEGLFGADLAKRMIKFSYAAPDFLFGLVSRLEIDCDARQNGTIGAASSDRRLAALVANMQRCKSYGLKAEVLDAHATREATGTDFYCGAIRYPQGGDVHPMKLVHALAGRSAELGASIFTSTKATELERHSRGWSIRTPKGTIRAEKVLIVTNGYTDSLWPSLRRSLVPAFSSMIATERLADDLLQKIVPGRVSVWESQRIVIHYRVTADGRLVIGGRGPMRPVKNLDELRFLIDHAVRLWPALRGSRWTNAWNGRVAITKDGLPHIHEPAPGLLCCLGYSGRGIALAAAFGPVLAGKLANETAIADWAITPLREIPFHRFWPLGARAAIGWGRLMAVAGR